MIKDIVIKEAKTKAEYLAFVKFPYSLYKENPNWVPPLINDEIETIDPDLNPVYQNANASFFLAYQDEKIVGRIAAIINWIEVKEIKKSKVRFGWFDVIDNINVSKSLIDCVIKFGKDHNLESIEGPLGFSNLDKAGLLIKGYEEQNTMITLYNHPYYSEHLKKLGFNEAAKWVEYEIKIDDFESSPEKVKRFSKLIMERYNLTLLNFKNRKAIIPYVDQMFELLDKTYNKLQSYVPIQDYQIENYKKRFLKFINPDFIKCIIDQQGKLICFSITMPSFTEALKKVNGKLTLFNSIHILKAMYFNKRASFYLIGVRPDYQNKGITAIIFNEMQKLFNKQNINIVETNPELEENTAIQKLWKNYEHRLHKRRATFSKKI
ncbi:MAG: GTP cyclohydrolase [Flavobacteriaceae bacterium]|nr:GTP cyclohydrolase [Flavobacteriaceae bacterium]MDG2236112.1 GTP cyclohydrolase [Flavobacteriaceae bacterium]